MIASAQPAKLGTGIRYLSGRSHASVVTYDTFETKAVSEGIEGIAFGDLFLEGVRCYRERQLKGSGLEPIFPVWGLPTRDLAQEMIASGVRAKLTCVDTTKLDQSFAGREFDQTCLSALPDGADACGERGEFHSFVYAGPMLDTAIPVSVGVTVVQDHFAFADLISYFPVQNEASWGS